MTTFTNVKERDKPEDRQGAVYKIKCSDCQATYIGKTGRNLSTRLTGHKRATRNDDVNMFTLLNTFTDETSNRLGLCHMYCVFYRLVSTTHFQKLVYQDKRHWIVVNNYWHRTNALLTNASKTNYERMTGQPTIWLTINDCFTVTIDGSKRTNEITSLQIQ